MRELQNMVEMLANLTGKPWICDEHIPENIRFKQDQSQLILEETDMNQVDRTLLVKALEKYGSSKNAKGKIAAALGISQSSVYRKLKKYNLDAES